METGRFTGRQTPIGNSINDAVILKAEGRPNAELLFPTPQKGTKETKAGNHLHCFISTVFLWGGVTFVRHTKNERLRGWF